MIEHLSTREGELDSSAQVAASELVEKLLEGLKPADRLLMRLMYLEGHSMEEIAALTGWNQSLIKVRAFRARARLRKRYNLLMKERQ